MKHEIQTELLAALCGLPASIRAVIHLKLRDGKTHEEIAAHLGISTRMVRKDLTAGYAELRCRLTYGVSSMKRLGSNSKLDDIERSATVQAVPANGMCASTRPHKVQIGPTEPWRP